MITPFKSKILVEPVVKQQILVAERKSLCEYGKVVSVGTEVKDIKVGDTIGFLVWGMASLEIDDKTYYFIDEQEGFILGTINE